MQSYDESSKEKSSESNFNGVIQPSNSQTCPEDKQLKLSPLSLLNKLRPSRPAIRTSNIAVEDPEPKNTKQSISRVGEHVTFNSRCSSVSTNERLGNIFINNFHPILFVQIL